MNFLQRLFLQSKGDDKEKPLTQPGKGVNHISIPPVRNINNMPHGIHVGKLSDVGRERDRNEDSFYVIESLISHDYGQEPFSLFIVADGMGGHQKGEVASSLATRAVAQHIIKEVYLPYLASNTRSSVNKPINEALIAAVENANTLVQEAVPDGGTTLTAALVMGNNAYIAHIGDTRAYLLNQGEIKQITKDHSYAQRLEELGQATPAEAAYAQNILYRAVGQDSTVEVDTYIQHLPSGSSLLLCSDGLWGPVEKDFLTHILNTSATPQEACERLIEKANENGGRDNITAIVATMGVED